MQLAVSDVLGQKAAQAARIVLRHERVTSLRLWGFIEVLFKILAAIILIPFWIYLLFVSLSASGDHGGDGTPRAARKKGGYPTLPFFHYHHDIVAEVLDSAGDIMSE